MTNQLFGALSKGGLTTEKRPLSILFSDQLLNQKVYLQRIDAEQAINSGINAELLCFATDSTIPLKSFIGCLVAVDQRCDDGRIFRLSGIITGAIQGDSDGAITSYLLTLEDPLSLMDKRANNRVFLNKSVLDVIKILFQDWKNRSKLFASSLSLDLSAISQKYEVRTQITQRHETDLQLFKRLLAEVSINYLIRESNPFVSSYTAGLTQQKLSLIDTNAGFQQLERQTIRFHRSDATEKTDTITSFVAKRTLQPTQVHVQRWRADLISQEDTLLSSKHKHSQNISNNKSGLEFSLDISPAIINDLENKDGADKADYQQIKTLSENQIKQFNLLAKEFIAQSTVRDAEVGAWFELLDYEKIDAHNGADNEYLIISKRFYNQNNISKDLSTQFNQLIKQSHWQDKEIKFDEERQGSILVLQRKATPIVPKFDPNLDKPKAQLMYCKVVGPEGESIYTDEWGRVKVRYQYSRREDNDHDCGAGSNDGANDSAWVEVATTFAGEKFGARFLPRIGEIVIVDHINGDIDRPIIIGRVHQSDRYPNHFDQKGKLPDTRYLSGISSREIMSSGYNQLRFDDTTGQISAQLQSSHGASQINLGNLSYPKEQEKSETRGEGFELRTDHWGAIRGGEGLLLTTYKQENAKKVHLEAIDAKKQLETNQNNIKALSETAKNHQVNEFETIELFKEFIDQIETEVAQFKKALLLLTSPEGIALSTVNDVYLSADGHINHIAIEGIGLSTQKNLLMQALCKISLFAAQGDATLVAGKGKIQVQSQENILDLLAKKGITIASTDEGIEILSPTEILIKGGSSGIKINSSGIYPTTTGLYENKAGQQSFKGGASLDKSAQLPKSKPLKGILDLLRTYGTDKFYENNKYKVIDALGKTFSGTLNGDGFAQVTGIAPGPANVTYEVESTSAWQSDSHFVRNYQWADGMTSIGKNAFSSFTDNMLSQLANNISSLSINSLKDMAKDAFSNVINQTVSDFSNQLQNEVIGSLPRGVAGLLSASLNTGITNDQLENINLNKSSGLFAEGGVFDSTQGCFNR